MWKSNHIKTQHRSDSLHSSPRDDIISPVSQAPSISWAPTVDKFSNEYQEPYFWIINDMRIFN